MQPAFEGTQEYKSLKRRPSSVRLLPKVTDLLEGSREELLEWWQTLFSAPAPKGLSQSFLKRFIAFELQSLKSGGIPKNLCAQLDRIDARQERHPAAALRPGGRLIREWNGVTHVVEVTKAGCIWNGKTYKSLSAVARAITGAQWSGPRFFGLTKDGAQ